MHETPSIFTRVREWIDRHTNQMHKFFLTLLESVKSLRCCLARTTAIKVQKWYSKVKKILLIEAITESQVAKFESYFSSLKNYEKILKHK